MFSYLKLSPVVHELEVNGGAHGFNQLDQLGVVLDHELHPVVLRERVRAHRAQEQRRVLWLAYAERERAGERRVEGGSAEWLARGRVTDLQQDPALGAVVGQKPARQSERGFELRVVA